MYGCDEISMPRISTQRFGDAASWGLPLTPACLCSITSFFCYQSSNASKTPYALRERNASLKCKLITPETRYKEEQYSSAQLVTRPHLCLRFRAFHLPLPLSDEGKRQEAVEDSPLLRTFPTGRVLWCDSHT